MKQRHEIEGVVFGREGNTFTASIDGNQVMYKDGSGDWTADNSADLASIFRATEALLTLRGQQQNPA